MQPSRNIEAPASAHRINSPLITNIVADADAMAIKAAHRIAEVILDYNARGEKTVLGLATGTTPIKVYAELVRMHLEEGLDFSNVVTFNLDEYFGADKAGNLIGPDHPESFRAFMDKHLFSKVNIKKDNIHFLNGSVTEHEVEAHCAAYEKSIRDAGGIDLQLLGIGENGHAGFNETQDIDPSFAVDSRTRKVPLDPRTVEINHSPSGQALTMGLGTILDAKECLLLATGEKKATAIAAAFDPSTDPATCPAAVLRQQHGNTRFIIDKAAASGLKGLDGECSVTDLRQHAFSR